MEVRARCKSGGPDITDCVAHGDAGAYAHPGSEVAHVTVAADHSVPVPDVDHVSVATLPSHEHNEAVTNRADRRTGRGGVVSSRMIPPLAENRVLPRAENARDAAECHGSAKESRP